MSLPPHIEYGFSVEAKSARGSLMRQVHGNALLEVRDPDHRAQLLAEPPEADACFTLAAGVRLHAFTADCLPVLLASDDPAGPVAAIHCGWRGAAAGIVGKTVERLSAWKGTLHAILGPSLLGCCFEVRSDLVEAFARAGYRIEPYLEKRGGRIFFHMNTFIIDGQLAGLSADRIHVDHSRCTYCSIPRLPSYRRNKGTDPRLCNWILKPTA